MRAGMISMVLLAAVESFGATFLVTTSADSGPGSLRQAIIDANANPGKDEILNGGAYEVALVQDLPVLQGPVFISLLGLLRPDAGTAKTGLTVSGSGVTVERLQVSRFSGDGLVLRDAFGAQVRSSRIWDVGGSAVVVEGGQGNQIGGAQPYMMLPGTENYFFNLGGSCVVLASDGSQVFNNYCGIGLPGDPVQATGGHGVHVRGGRGNTITTNFFSNVDDGVHVSAGDAWIDQNESYQIRGRDIALGSASPPNDAVDADDGPNRLQNFPTLDSVARDAWTMRIRGTLQSEPNQQYEIRLYDRGVGCSRVRTLGSFRVVTDDSGIATYDRNLRGFIGSGSAISATATSLFHYATSEQSPCVQIEGNSAVPDADIGLRAFVLTPAIAPGAELQILLEATNYGPTTAPYISLGTGYEPSGADLIGIRLLEGSGTCWGGRSCTTEPIRPGGRAVLAVSLRVTASVGSDVLFTAGTSTDYGADKNEANNYVSMTLPVTATATALTSDLDVSIMFEDPTSWKANDFRAVAVVRNRGAFLSSNVRIAMQVQGAVTAFGPTGDDCQRTQNPGECIAGVIPANGSVRVQIEGTLDPTRGVIATIMASSATPDPSVTNNTARAVLNAVSSVPLSSELLLAIGVVLGTIAWVRLRH